MRLTTDNLDLLKQLRSVYAEAFDESEKYQNIPNDEYLLQILEDKKYISLVSLNDEGGVVGGLTAYVLDKIERPQSELYLYDLAVLEAYRRQGIATILIEELKSFGKKVGAYVIFVQADNIDKPTLALYEKISTSKETDISHFDIVVE
jgi:aminoglycoside 3-N-acetyltransferase I